jgi:multiple sugar transport system substrate-binding protein
MDSYLDTGSMLKDMPQLASFTVDGHVVGIPYDASFMVTTINKAIFDKAGADPEPKTIDAYTNALKKIQQAGTVNYPLNIPFSAAEGLSTYWYETTGAFGGTILDEKGMPQFSTPDSAGYKAMQWMVDALKNGLVPPGNINVSDSQGQQTLMAKGKVASTCSDYSGNIGSLYNLKSASSVVGDVHYLRTPGVSGPAGNLSNPDGIGIPKQAKDPQAAATFIKWFTEKNQQLNFSGVNGASKALEGYNMPSRLSAVQVMTQKGALVQGQILGELLKKSQPVFKGGAPKWYPQFSNAVYTNLHAAAAGSMDVASAIKTISDTAERLAQNGS